jgi:hypothetical protein
LALFAFCKRPFGQRDLRHSINFPTAKTALLWTSRVSSAGDAGEPNPAIVERIDEASSSRLRPFCYASQSGTHFDSSRINGEKSSNYSTTSVRCHCDSTGKRRHCIVALCR